MLPSSLTLLVDMAAQLAWPVTQALFHSLWLGVLIAACLRVLERIARRSFGESAGGGTRPEPAARHRFALSLTAMALIAASLPLSFSLVFDRAAFDEAVAAARHVNDAASDSSANLLDAMPIAQMLDDARSTAGPTVDSLAEPATKAPQADAWNNSALQRLKADTRRCAPMIAALYGVGVLAMLLRLAIGICGGRRLATGGQRLTDSALLASLHEQANRLGLRLHPLVATCERVAVPVVVGVVRPVILLPASLLSGLAPEDVETILAHELAHLRRRDHLTIVVQRGLEAVLFYHPIAWWLGRRIDAFREDACDDLVLDSGIDRLDYATTLLRVAELRTSTAEKRQQLAQLAVDGGHPSKLRRRIERIVASGPNPGVRVRQSRSGLALITACVALALAFLVQIPVQSQIASPLESATSKEVAGDRSPDSTSPRPESPPANAATASNEPDPIRQKLDSRTDFTADEMPLVKVLDFVERKSGVPVEISLGECMLRGVNGWSPVTLAVKDATFAEILSQATLALNLTFEITPDGIRIPAKTPAFEFRIVPELPTSNASICLPDDWKENTYRDGTGGETNVRQHPGFAWFPVQPIKDDSVTLPAMESRGTGKRGLLSDDAQHILTPDGRWHVQEVHLEDDANGQKRLVMTIDEVGGAHIRKLTRAAMNQKIAMLVHGVVIMAPTVRGEISEKLAISGNFSDEQWRLIESSIRQAMLPPDDEFGFDCDVTDLETGEPIAGVEVLWRVRRDPSRRDEPPLFEQRFITNEDGKYRVTLSRDVYQFAHKGVEFESSHRDYVPKNPISLRLQLPHVPEFRPDVRLMKLRRGSEVTGRFLQPDGTPAANLLLMVSRNRRGTYNDYAERVAGYTDSVTCRTDKTGHFRIVTSPNWPKRLHWYPDEFVSDSVALRKATDLPEKITFGDQGTIKLKHGPRLTGRVVDDAGRPLANFNLEAVTGTTVPIRYTTTDATGAFAFPPLPPGEYSVGSRVQYFDVVRKHLDRRSPSRPFDRATVTLEAGKNARPLMLRQRPARKVVIKAFDESGLPMTTARFSAGELTGGKTTANHRDVESEPVSDVDGSHQLWVRFLPDNDPRQGLSVRTRADQAVFWQQTTDGPVVPGAGIVLARETSEVVAQFVQAGTVHLRVKNGERSVEPDDLSLNVAYARAAEFAKPGVFSPGFRITQPSAGNEWTIQSIAPGEDVVIEASIKGALLKRHVLRTGIGEAKNLTIDLASADENVPSISAPIKDDDGIEVPAGKLAPPVELKLSTLTVKCDIANSDEEARIFVRRVGGTEGPIGSRRDGPVTWTPAANGKWVKFEKLLPGSYMVGRPRVVELITEQEPASGTRPRHITQVILLDRQTISLASGAWGSVTLSRGTGQRVSGTVVCAPDTTPSRMIVIACSPTASGIDDVYKHDITVFDAQQCNDGEFVTDALEPGEYSLFAVGYDAWPKEAFTRSGYPQPRYAGSVKLVVPRNDPVKKVRVPLYRIHSPI
jgi:beta-lactamase regulating signal transducer with metallopeptidase domain